MKSERKETSRGTLRIEQVFVDKCRSLPYHHFNL
jgi:hypothetical protein